ncbi:LOW QUALITY PROTEIN: spliceosome-associated protein CWC27 homolog [Lepeophtheirus salmonis]|uniref:LOW QUALITY PROTEIN: spliceosome-associated protein CWC27 homolog n=1 Tax=Lepeophtheirus salmonis TaxID=72036 RepID=UPI003AF3A240
MSNIYVQEPPTQGKVLLETSVGDIEIELWAKECPKASRNFIQLCLENYYNKTNFFRVIRDFIVQGGDPTNTGNGGESVFEGGAFKDEFHSRLRFVRRGLVAMANSDKKDTNGSQFFFTMGQTPELQNKHTIFGKIAGDTIYNAMKLQEGEVEDETPVRPHKIYKTRVIHNPFPDVAPRKNFSSRDDKKKEKKSPESKMKAAKDFKLLSFGDEAEEEEDDLEETLKKEVSKPSGKSSHDLLEDPKLLKSSIKLENEDAESPERKLEETNEDTLISIRDKLKRKSIKKVIEIKSSSSEGESEDEEVKEKRRRKEEIQKEIKELKKSMRTDKGPLKDNLDGDSNLDEDQETEEEKKNEILKDFHLQQKKFKEIQSNLPKKKTVDREKLTMQLLEQFKTKLAQATEEEEPELKNEDDDSGWMSHKLMFKSDNPVLAKDASTKNDDWFDIYDPRNPINKRRRGDGSTSKRRK